MNPEEAQQHINHFQRRVLQAEQLRREKKFKEAEELMPSREELISVLRAHREYIFSKSEKRSIKSAGKQQAEQIRKLEDLNALFD